MAVVKLRFLSKDEEDIVHALTLKTLETIGVLIRSQSVLRILDEAGATVDFSSGIARIPESLVKEALARAPKSIRMCARDKRYDMQLPVEAVPYCATTGLGIFMKDLETGEERETTRADLALFARLADALPQVDFFWPSVTAGDVPQQVHTIHELWVSLQNQTKHIQGDSVSALDARKQIELASLVVDGEEELRRRPIFSVVSCPIAPLSFERGAIEGQVEFARAGIPVCSLSMSLSGGSAPVTMAGTIVNANAENLASLVVTELSSPGAPHIYGSNSSPISMQTGNIDYEAVETPIIAAAMGQMAKRYGLPSQVADWGVNADDIGIMKSICELTSTALTMFANSDLSQGFGSFRSAKGASLEQMVIDAYMWENYKAFMRKIVINEQSAALDIIKAVGHGGTFLTHPHTMHNFRKELHFRDKKKLSWEATLSNKMVPEAREIAKRLLREHTVAPLDRDIIEEGDKLLREYEKMTIA
jgi:trimethylamine--corrinoid protein Co-methyltransferase